MSPSLPFSPSIPSCPCIDGEKKYNCIYCLVRCTIIAGEHCILTGSPLGPGGPGCNGTKLIQN